MPLSIGDRLGPYEILAPIGAGGMGEVFRALDPRTHREIAIKISPERFSERFDREVRAIAALNHTNICHLYDVGPNYLVMELVDGPTLAERIALGAIPLEESLNIAKQIADALDAAHEKGIIHRDLKPGNIKIKPDGTVKVLDFGLAKIGGTPTAKSEDSPTISMAATQAGVILGTAAYMSPEQARGKPVDKRADIWAFGVVLYEMLTGKPLFHGDTITDILAAVVRHDPDWKRIPPKVRRLLRSCLQKDPKDRLQAIGDWRLLLDDSPLREDAPAHRWLWPGVAAVLALCLLGLSVIHLREKPVAESDPVRFQVPRPERQSPNAHTLISPDGRKLVFSDTGIGVPEKLWFRSLDSLEARPLPGAAGSGTPSLNPFWSADSRSVAFSVDGKLKKVAIAGGPVQTICDTADGDTGGGAWNSDGVIIFGSAAHGLFRVSAAGGVASPVTVLDASREETYHRRPVFLPDSVHFLYVRVSKTPENTGIYIGSLEAKPEEQSRKRLMEGQIGVGYAPSSDPNRGYVLFLRESTLMAQPFDARRLELTGEAAPVAENVGSNNSTTGYFSASSTGALAYQGSAGSRAQLTWYDRQGKKLGEVGEPAFYNDLRLSPDGTRVAVSRQPNETGKADLWLQDLSRGASTRFTFDPASELGPVWSPDGGRIAFVRDDSVTIYQKPSNGASSEEALLHLPGTRLLLPKDWSSDGHFLLYSTNGDVMALPLEGDRKPIPIASTPAIENNGQFSPDAHWIAYNSTESGGQEVYVVPFPVSAQGGRWLVSTNGGVVPRWRRDGKELFYLSLDRKMMAADVSTSGTFKAGAPHALFQTQILTGGGFRWDVSADGSRFLIESELEGARSAPITVILNWTSLLRK